MLLMDTFDEVKEYRLFMCEKKYFISSVILLTFFLSSCSSINQPPSAEEMQNILDSNKENLNEIVDFIIDFPCEDLAFWDSSGTMEADLETVIIPNEEVVSAVSNLIDTELFIKIYKIRNTIVFLQWRGAQDIGCGLAYSINGIDKPEVQFGTELIPLSENGWYYYVADYNEWRRNH